MAIKTILCAYSGEAAKGAALNHAMRLARHHEAWVTGVVRHGTPKLAKRYRAQVPQELLDILDQRDDQQISEIQTRFADVTAAAGLADRAEFVELNPEAGVSLAAFAHSFDLIVTGHYESDRGDEHLAANADLLALKSGRPILVVPDAYEAEGLAERALVAWDGKRASARAIGDAMELLAEKAEVTLLSVGSAPAETDRMVQNLTRHGINVIAETRPRQASVAETILAAAADHGARLIVSGAYEHSKFSHDILGGVTTELQSKAQVPVFMSH